MDEAMNEYEQQIDHRLKIFNLARRDSRRFLIRCVIEVTLYSIGLDLMPNNCSSTGLQQFVVLMVVNACCLTALALWFVALVEIDYYNLVTRRISNTLPYDHQNYSTHENLQDAIIDRYMVYKIWRYLCLALNLGVFLLGQSMYSNLNGSCQIGVKRNNYTWAVVFIFLITRYVLMGLPLLYFFAYMLFAPIWYCINASARNKIRPVGATSEQINSLQVNIAKGKVYDENICNICLQEFEDGEEYVRMHCHTNHLFHKLCILEWLNLRQDCPTCRTKI